MAKKKLITITFTSKLHLKIACTRSQLNYLNEIWTLLEFFFFFYKKYCHLRKSLILFNQIRKQNMLMIKIISINTLKFLNKTDPFKNINVYQSKRQFYDHQIEEEDIKF